MRWPRAGSSRMRWLHRGAAILSARAWRMPSRRTRMYKHRKCAIKRSAAAHLQLTLLLRAANQAVRRRANRVTAARGGRYRRGNVARHKRTRGHSINRGPATAAAVAAAVKHRRMAAAKAARRRTAARQKCKRLRASISINDASTHAAAAAAAPLLRAGWPGGAWLMLAASSKSVSCAAARHQHRRSRESTHVAASMLRTSMARRARQLKRGGFFTAA